VQRDPVGAVVEERPEEPLAFVQPFRCRGLPHARPGGRDRERKRDGHGGGDHQQREQDDVPLQERKFLFDVVDVDSRPDEPSPRCETPDVGRLLPHPRRFVHEGPLVIDEPSVGLLPRLDHPEEQRRNPFAVRSRDLAGRESQISGGADAREPPFIRHDPYIILAARAETQVGQTHPGDAFRFVEGDLACEYFVVL
jgi:hypothetical protein